MSTAQPLTISPGATLDISWDWTAWLDVGETITAREVVAVSPLTKGADAAVAGVVTASWQIYVRRYSQQVSTATRPDVKLFLAAVSNGIKAAAAATPQ